MYSPLRHLKDMKQIQIEDQDVRQEMFDINRQIDEKIDELIDNYLKNIHSEKRYIQMMICIKRDIININLRI